MAKQKRITKGDEPRQCYAILHGQHDEHGYIPSLVIENEAGHSPLVGKDDLATPWYWGKTFEKAWEVADRLNMDRYGITHRTAQRIICSSMFPGSRL